MTLAIANTRDVLQAVADFDVDLGFIEGARAPGPTSSCGGWLSDELIVVAAPGYPLVAGAARRQAARRGDLIVRELVGTREASDRWLSAELARVEVELELGSNEAVNARSRRAGIGCPRATRWPTRRTRAGWWN